MTITVLQTARAVREGRLSALALIESRLARIEALDSSLNCFTQVMAERARREAAAVDALVAGGGDPGPLAGIPFGVKDNYDIAGRITSAGSIVNRSLPPASRDAVLVRRLVDAGAVLVGAQNMDEFAYGFTTENHHYGATRNPLDPIRSAGGSSGGSAASVAAGLVDIALGTDTNGSIRVPASFCGVFGLRPTFGRLPRSGIFPLVHDLDQPGPLAGNVADLAAVYDAIQGHDGGDPACADTPNDPALPYIATPFHGSVGILDGWFDELADDQGRAAVAAAADVLGATGRVTLAGAAQARAAAYIMTCAAAGNLHFDALAARAEEFDPATRDRLLAGTLVPAHLLLRAQRYRTVFREQVLDAFRRFDLLLAPATPCSATELGQSVIPIAGEAVPARANLGVLTQPLSFVGLPIVAAPVRNGAMPIAVQIVAPPWHERLALQAAAQLERAGIVRGPDPLP